MAKPEWGTKRQCPSCGGRFYDLGKANPVVCIKCEHAFEPEVLLKPRRVRPDDKPIDEIKLASSDELDDDLEDDVDTVSLEDLEEVEVEDDEVAAVADIPDLEIDEDLDLDADVDDSTLLETEDDDDVDLIPRPSTDD
ncbi:MAG: hypothetical protein Dbin4_01219 [Alphaproteobacteria bacterium]|nr:hypothetical protein [Alphaproteobacteria bacterium]